MSSNRQSEAVRFAFVALVAAIFFCAGYSARTVRMASAQVPDPGGTARDGNPSGHDVVPNKPIAVAGSPNPALIKCLKKIAAAKLEVHYVTGLRTDAYIKNDQLVYPKPTCGSNPHCVPFTWTNMTVRVRDRSGDTVISPETVDIFGTFTVR
jgi:hypothetical protein